MLRASHTATDQLMRPPLMRQFVRRNKIREIDIFLRVENTLKEERFSEG